MAHCRFCAPEWHLGGTEKRFGVRRAEGLTVQSSKYKRVATPGQVPATGTLPEPEPELGIGSHCRFSTPKWHFGGTEKRFGVRHAELGPRGSSLSRPRVASRAKADATTYCKAFNAQPLGSDRAKPRWRGLDIDAMRVAQLRGMGTRRGDGHCQWHSPAAASWLTSLHDAAVLTRIARRRAAWPAAAEASHEPRRGGPGR